jgi:Lar family restriction alleviation protein|tara:strand:+ start:54 stop:230 length:177 start_codon:yes stop_codon:yes gene_type:complete
MREELKPCPFCGSKPEMGSLGGDEENWAIWCEGCSIPCADGGSGETKEEIVIAWNRRK